MEKVLLEAKTRVTKSKSSKKNLRKSGKIPGVFYSKRNEPLSIEVPENSFKPLIFTSETHLINLKVDGGNEFDCIIKAVQFDPVSDRIVHFDLIGLSSDEKIQIEVPLIYTGSAVGVKDGGILQTSLHKILVECLPADIPQNLEISITDLKLGDSIHVSDLNYERISLVTPKETVLISVVHPKVEKAPEEAPAEAVPAEPEVIGKGKAEEEEEEES